MSTGISAPSGSFHSHWPTLSTCNNQPVACGLVCRCFVLNLTMMCTTHCPRALLCTGLIHLVLVGCLARFWSRTQYSVLCECIRFTMCMYSISTATALSFTTDVHQTLLQMFLLLHSQCSLWLLNSYMMPHYAAIGTDHLPHSTPGSPIPSSLPPSRWPCDELLCLACPGIELTWGFCL